MALPQATYNYSRNIEGPELTRAGVLLTSGLTGMRDRELAQAKSDEEQRRWDIANARAQRKEDRELAEQTAKDVANDILSKGVQARGGILNTQNVIDRLSPSDLTAEEIAFSNANKITTADQARALGKEDLANKLDVQTRFSSDVDAMYNRGMLNETRPQMYERAMSELVSRGLHTPDKLVERLDAARLYEEKAREDAIKSLETKEAEIAKRQREDAWKTIGAMPGMTSVDAEGNIVDGKGVKGANKDSSKGILTIQEAVNKAGFSPEKKAAAITMADSLVRKLEAMDIPANVAAEFVTNEMSKKEGNPFLSYIGISNQVPNFDTKTIDTLASTLAGRIRNEGTGSVQKEPSRFDLALKYADSSRVSDASELAKIRAQKEALMMTPEERTLSKIDAYLKESSLPDYDTLRSNFGNMELKGSGLSGMDNYLNKLGVVESQNNYNAVNSTSKATGKYQMVGNTAEEYMRKLGYSGTKEELVEKFKSSPELQEKAIRAYTLDNAKTLSDKGIPVNDWSLWVSHSLGIGNAVKVLNGNIDNNVIDAVKRNLPKGVAPTMENYIKTYYNKMNAGDAGTETPNSFFGRDIKTGAKLTTADEMLKKDEADLVELRSLTKPIVEKVKPITTANTDFRDLDVESLAGITDRLKKERDEVNSSQLPLEDKIKRVRELDSMYNEAKDILWGKRNKDYYSKNLFELIGLGDENRVKTPKYSLGKDDNAKDEEKGLEHDFTWVPGLGWMNKYRNTASTYDDVYKGVFGSNSLTKGRRLDDILSKNPLEASDDVIRQVFGKDTKMFDITNGKSLEGIIKRYSDMSRTDLLTEATRLRNIENPTDLDLTQLRKIQQLLRSVN